MPELVRIDRIIAARTAAKALLKLDAGPMPQPEAIAICTAAQAWATLAQALGDDTIEVERSRT